MAGKGKIARTCVWEVQEFEEINLYYSALTGMSVQKRKQVGEGGDLPFWKATLNLKSGGGEPTWPKPSQNC